MIDLMFAKHELCLIAANMMASGDNRDDQNLNNYDLIKMWMASDDQNQMRRMFNNGLHTKSEPIFKKDS